MKERKLAQKLEALATALVETRQKLGEETTATISMQVRTTRTHASASRRTDRLRNRWNASD